MEEPVSSIPYWDPLDSPSFEKAFRFWEESHINFDFDPQNVPPEMAEPIFHSQKIPEFGNKIAGPSNPIDGPLYWDVTNNFINEGDCGDDSHERLMDFRNETINHENRNPENVNTCYENTMPLSICPPPPPAVPFSCSCCQVIRQIIHSNGTYTTKLEVHGRVGMIFHAVLETPCNTDGLPSLKHQMIDFTSQSMESVKQFLTQYCQERQQAGFFTLEDPLSPFYDTVLVGLKWDDENTADTTQPRQTESGRAGAGAGQVSHTREESRPGRVTKSSLAAQRERTGKLKLSDFTDYFHLPMEVAAKRLEICPTVLKRICRRDGMKRWPYRKIKAYDRKISEAKDAEQVKKLIRERAQACTVDSI